MDREKLARLEASGWTSGSTQEFLQVVEEESACVDLKVPLVADPKKEGTETE